MRQLISSRPDAKLLFSFLALSTSLAVFLCKCRRKEKRSKETPFSRGNFLKKVSSGLLQKLFDNYSREVKAGNPATVAGMSGVHPGGTFLSLPCVRGGAALPRGEGVVPNTNYPLDSFKNFSATTVGKSRRVIRQPLPGRSACIPAAHSPSFFQRFSRGSGGAFCKRRPRRVPTAPLHAGQQLLRHFFVFLHAFRVAVVIARRLTKPRRLRQTHVAADLRFKHAVAVMLFQLRQHVRRE